MTRVRIGVVGAGLIGQVEHIPNLQRLPAQYQLVGIADASPRMRAELERRGFRALADYRNKATHPRGYAELRRHAVRRILGELQG